MRTPGILPDRRRSPAATPTCGALSDTRGADRPFWDAPIRALLVALLSLGVATGCARHSSLPSYVHRSETPSARSEATPEATVTVDPFFDPARSREYFGINAIHQDLAILFVRVENRTSERSLMLPAKSIRLAVGEGNAGGTQEYGGGRGAAEAIMITGAALLSLPLLFIGGGLYTKAERIQHNMAMHEIRSGSINPGQAVEGFVYFKVNAKPNPDSVTLSVPVVDLRQDTTNWYRFPMPYERSETQ